jgi:hypothetical protein
MESRQPKDRRRATSQRRKKRKPWMTWLGVYQSVRCCEFSELTTSPCQKLDVAAFADRLAADPQEPGGGD